MIFGSVERLGLWTLIRRLFRHKNRACERLFLLVSIPPTREPQSTSSTRCCPSTISSVFPCRSGRRGAYALLAPHRSRRSVLRSPACGRLPTKPGWTSVQLTERCNTAVARDSFVGLDVTIYNSDLHPGRKKASCVVLFVRCVSSEENHLVIGPNRKRNLHGRRGHQFARASRLLLAATAGCFP